MKSKVALFALFSFLAFASQSQAIVIEPDAYASGTNLTSVSPYATLNTSGGGPVYASPIHSSDGLAAGGRDTGPLGERVFSRNPDNNSEWLYWPDVNPADPHGLEVDFKAPVTSFSLFFAELFPDAGCCYTDPTFVSLFDVEDRFLARLCMDCQSPEGYLGEKDSVDEAFPYWKYEYSGATIGRMIVGGESEPTTLDRLEFSVEAKVPEPSSLGILMVGLMGLGLAKKRNSL